MTTEPLIHTTRGNLPVSSLKFEVKWSVSDDYVSMTEIYTASDGEIVRQDAHVCALKGAQVFSAASDQI